MGRKRMETGDRRSVEIKIRLTPAEKDGFDKEARMAGMGTSTYVRNLALGRKVKLVNPIVLDASDIRPAVVQLARAGNNLNQVAHWLNWHTSMGDGLRRQVGEAIEEVLEATRELTAMAGGKLPKRWG